MLEQDQPKGEPPATDREEKGRLLVMGSYMADMLSQTQREQAETLVKWMQHSLHESEKYLSDYLAGRVNAAKTYGIIRQTATQIQEQMEEILRMYQK